MRPDVSARDRHVFDVEEHGLHRGAPLEPCLMVIFGAAGDLARRELVPSLFELHRKQLLPERFAVIGFSQGRWMATSVRFRPDVMQGDQTLFRCGVGLNQ